MNIKWFKSYKGELYNVNYIIEIYWKTNSTSASTLKYELHAILENSRDVILGGCNNESDKVVIMSSIEKFFNVNNGNAILGISKIEA